MSGLKVNGSAPAGIVGRWQSGWNAGQANAIADLFRPEGAWIVDGQVFAGRDAIAGRRGQQLGPATQSQLLLRRGFTDRADADWSAAEGAVRWQSETGAWQEVELALLFHTRDGLIESACLHHDWLSLRPVEPDAPLAAEHKSPDIPAPTRDMTLDELMDMQRRHVKDGWAHGDADAVLACHAPVSAIISPFVVTAGHAMIREAVSSYTAGYADTQVDIHRIVYDGRNIALQQTWTCTNRQTGERAADHDLIVGLVQDGLIWYWREYFDARTSAQKLDSA